MARKPRCFIPGVSAHIIKRGNNSAPVFSRHSDYLYLLECLREASSRHAAHVHAFVLMTNHIHVVATPAAGGSVPALMKEVGERYSTYFNAEYSRTGTPWDGRYRAFLLADERYWLTCLRYVEQNPVRARMVMRPEDYEWSSYAAHGLGQEIGWLHPHPVFDSLGTTRAERAAVYRRLCNATLTEEDVRILRKHQASAAASMQRRGQTPGSDPEGGVG